MANPYLQGAHAPVAREITLTDLRVTGALPESLDGRYLRNGPNPIGEVDPATYHWFTGTGMIHGIRLREGRAEWYRNRWVRGPAAAAQLGEPERPSSGDAGMDLTGPNTNVLGHAGKTLALTEGGIANMELDYELGTVGPCDFGGTISGGYTAHPKRDPATGELHAVSYSFARGNQVQYSVIGVDGRARRTVDVTVGGSTMMHDFSLTENYVVFYDLPVTFDLEKVLGPPVVTTPLPLSDQATLVAGAAIGGVTVPDPITAAAAPTPTDSGIPYSWKPGYRTRVGVMPRDGGDADVRWFDIDPCFVFHPLNAYEVDDTIVLDLARHPKAFDADDERDGAISTLERWTVKLGGGDVTQTLLDDLHQEFPRIDERFTGRRHRYGYTVGLTPGAASVNHTLVKHDLVAATSQIRDFGPATAIGEFVFEPAAPDSPEGHGYLMGLVSHLADDTTDLTILDAATLETLATVHLPVRVPTGFHGNWIPD
ncbi:carotenoid oxygenase family protein [Cryptosporangium aurantiacum]|uniref:Dioxygenase n=1 Tax=Cryptosporangium aurantiacum TaxID=134849 RepID=A0A1M7R0Z1_9ACTN|nr:carotenoid oxygenase family protein [Cryptosporangium aurantiacum]SHN38295.1 carotenoid cleavage dioxygenase [Cryptosporangium aurantiacum]